MCILRATLLTIGVFSLFLAIPRSVPAQKSLSGAAEIRLAIDRLNVRGSVLMIAAHPDDENTALLAYFSRGRKMRTGYLSLTRGEGGQNLIGPEQGDLLGVIRTQELLSARRMDGAEQYFTRAVDFGFTKTVEETLSKWGRDTILGDIVWVIRRFRPDVIVLRFSGTPRDGHGQHQTSAILGREAFDAAADPKRFPEQLSLVQPWKAKRIVYNTFAFTREQEAAAAAMPGRIEIDTGEFDPVLGYSYSEIAGMSRSQHRSQGMGAAERRGSQKNYFAHAAGDPARSDLFDGVDTSVGGEAGAILQQAARGFDMTHPEKAVPILLRARDVMGSTPDKLAEIDEAIALCAGLWLDASADRPLATPGEALKISITALNRSPLPVTWEKISLEGMKGAPSTDTHDALEPNRPATQTLSQTIPQDQPVSQPYWLTGKHDLATAGLAEGPPILRARFHLTISGKPLELVRPVHHRFVDRVRGELTRPLAIVPPIALRFSQTSIIFPSDRPRTVEIEARANAPQTTKLRFSTSPGWRVAPEAPTFNLAERGEQTVASFTVEPPSSASTGKLSTDALTMHIIDYPHIPPQVVFQKAEAKLVRGDIKTLAHTVGYIMGAGDEVPDALRQLGCDVTLLRSDDLAHGDLSRFDAIVTGVRAFNTRSDLHANHKRLLDYVAAGGTMIVQYNVLEGGPFGGGDPTLLSRIGPYPLTTGRDRVTVEEAPVTFPHPDHPVLQSPNKITAADFDGWVQERGLYFAAQWDQHYEPILESHDPGEKPPLPGGTLFARHGKGVYIFTAYSWFRQLPAGVPGAYRVFANFISAGKVVRQ
jgi:LmbE family N-acetylglucosaminyl deacetylase